MVMMWFLGRRKNKYNDKVWIRLISGRKPKCLLKSFGQEGAVKRMVMLRFVTRGGRHLSNIASNFLAITNTHRCTEHRTHNMGIYSWWA